MGRDRRLRSLCHSLPLTAACDPGDRTGQAAVGPLSVMVLVEGMVLPVQAGGNMKAVPGRPGQQSRLTHCVANGTLFTL
jgi:hypothetical protein